MIQLTPKLMALAQQKQVREWLRSAPALLYRQHLLDLSAQYMAEAAMCLAGDETQQGEGKALLDKSELHTSISDVMAYHASRYDFTTFELKPRHATRNEYASTDRNTTPGPDDTEASNR